MNEVKEVKAEYIDLSVLPGFPVPPGFKSACARIAKHSVSEEQLNSLQEIFGVKKLTDLEVSNKLFGDLQDFYKTNVIRVYLKDRTTRICNALDQELGRFERVGEEKFSRELLLTKKLKYECTNFPEDLVHEIAILCRFGQVIV